MTTLKDIAAAAGVSIGTVDRALKDRGRVNPQVAQHIKDLAKEMDYHPNKIASGLVNRSRNYKIAVILHITGNDFFNEVLKGVKKRKKKSVIMGCLSTSILVMTLMHPCSFLILKKRLKMELTPSSSYQSMIHVFRKKSASSIRIISRLSF